jgi:hypothetical protein
MDHPERQLRRRAPPQRGRDRGRRAGLRRGQVGLEIERGQGRALRQDQRIVDDRGGTGDPGSRPGPGARAEDERAPEQHRGRLHAATLALSAAAALAGCQGTVGDVDGAYYAWDGRRVQCGISIDTTSGNADASILSGLDRARDRGEVLELYGHIPGQTIGLDRVEAVLAGARDRGLRFVTYEELAAASRAGTPPAPVGGLALGFDDNAVDAWMTMRDLLARYDAHVTFFVSRYTLITDAQRAEIAQLAADGHAIEAHTVHHLHGPAYVERYGLDAYLHDEVLPSIEVLRGAGYPVGAFAYPFGERTAEIDDAILPHVQVLRSTASPWGAPVVTHPCPY